LRGVDLGNADLTRTYLFLTRLDGADLSGTRGLTQDQFEIACGTGETRLPVGLVQPASWPCPSYEDE